MKNFEKNLIVIPARMASTRLPGKPLIDIEGVPMVVRVAQQAIKSDLGKVIVACCDEQVYDLVTKNGLIAVMTNPELKSGSDRVFEALEKIDPTAETDIVINLQGDYPTINPSSIRALLSTFEDPSVRIATLASIIKNKKEIDNINVVKVVIGENYSGGNALYFSRCSIPFGDGPLYHHIGIYAYKREALQNFVNLKPSQLEKRERLEQLRALEGGIPIYVKVVDEFPIGVDTASDLSNARKFIRNQNI